MNNIYKYIYIKNITLINFKGVEYLSIKFPDIKTTIKGDNGVGKSTIVDAYLWTLFGKNSANAKFFSVKRLDADGKIVAEIKPTVKMTLQIITEEEKKVCVIQRSLHEKYKYDKQKNTYNFIGNTEKFFWNEEEVTATKYKENLNALCPLEEWYYMTTLQQFCCQSKSTQLKTLLKIIGEEANTKNEEEKKKYKTERKEREEQIKACLIRSELLNDLLKEAVFDDDAFDMLDTKKKAEDTNVEIFNKYLQRIAILEDKIREKEEKQMAQIEKKLLNLFVNNEHLNIKIKTICTCGESGNSYSVQYLLNGVPYEDANTATRMQFANEVITTMSKSVNTCVPLFIDNVESLNHLCFNNAFLQTVFLRVTNDKNLIIEQCQLK